MNQPNVTHMPRDPRSYGAATPGVTPRPPFNPSGDRPKFVAKGHDSQLQDAQMNKLPMQLTLISGSVIEGTITKRDKYTITVRHSKGENAGCDEIFYKHAIEGVLIKRETAQQ